MDTRAWLSVIEEAIPNCFQKCGFTDDACRDVDTNGEEFANILKEISLEISLGDFVVPDDAAPFCRATFNIQAHIIG